MTAKVEEQDRVMGLLSGGDDYVLKPFSLKELDARIIAHLKREERLHRKTEQRFYGDLVIDYAGKCVHMKEKTLDLTKLEYDIIEFLSIVFNFITLNIFSSVLIPEILIISSDDNIVFPTT